MKETQATLQILIATMYRDNLDFLEQMFPHGFAHLHLIIVNQTVKNKIISADFEQIKVVNSFERGLSKSRNLALKNATKPLCLITDDDVVFLKDFDTKITNAFSKNSQETVITFQTKTPKGKLFWNYPKKCQKHKYLNKILSHEIVFKREAIQQVGITFDEQFGLGAAFEDSENFIFLHEVKDKLQMPYFCNETVAMHSEQTSSDAIASNRHIYARAALNYKFKKNKVYLWLIKLLFFLWRTKRIKFNEITDKWHVAIQGIEAYKKQNNE